MKKQVFHRVGSSDREADVHLIWTIGWSFVALSLSIISVFQL
jgi:hypothetical protein